MPIFRQENFQLQNGIWNLGFNPGFALVYEPALNPENFPIPFSGGSRNGETKVFQTGGSRNGKIKFL